MEEAVTRSRRGGVGATGTSALFYFKQMLMGEKLTTNTNKESHVNMIYTQLSRGCASALEQVRIEVLSRKFRVLAVVTFLNGSFKKRP